MSILNGNVSYDIVHSEEHPFGKALSAANIFKLDGLMDIKISHCGKFAFAACKKCFYILDISDKCNINVVSSVEGLVNGRQMDIIDGVAYITLRENGLVAIDIHDYQKPYIKWYYETLELATGIFAKDGYVYVTNRHIGMEIVDVSGEKPLYISSVYCGEAQSVFVDKDIAYIGDWMNRKIRVIDVTDKENPKEISSFNLDGFADGIFVKDGICYAATGHHSASLKNRRKFGSYEYITREMLDEGYGCGHGLEIFDVTKPYSCEYISSVKFPPLYFGCNDSWRVNLSGNIAYVCDTYNGLFAVDVSNLTNPEIVNYYHSQELSESSGNITVQKLYKPLVYAAVTDGYVLAAGCEDGLHIIEYDKAKRMENTSDIAVKQENIDVNNVFKCTSHIHSFAELDGFLILACGDEGIYVLDKNYNVISNTKTQYAVKDLCVIENKICTAESIGGVAIYTFEKGKAEFESRLQIEDNGKRVVSECVAVKDKIVLRIDTGALGIVRYKDDTFVLETITRAGGVLYKRNICKDSLNGQVFIKSLSYCFSIFDAKKGEFELRLSHEQSCPIEDGIAVKDGKCIILFRYGYSCDTPDNIKNKGNIDFFKVENAWLNGAPFVCEDRLFILNVCTKTAEILDIKDTSNPVFITRLALEGTPEFAGSFNGKVLICTGHGGLFEVN